MNHTIYVSKRSVLGQGISFQDLNLLLETIEDVKIVEWTAHQGNWLKEIPSLVSSGVSTVIIPSVWALTAPDNLPEDFLGALNSGRVRIVYFNKKLDAPNYTFPSLSIPSDRGSLILEAMVNLMGDSVDRGLHSFFPEQTEVLAHNNITSLETLSFDLEQLFKEFLKKVKKLMLHKVKVSIALKSLVRWIYDHEAKRPDKIEISLGFANNLFGFTCRWRTSLSNVKALVEENNSLTGIASSTSALWFNFFPENNTIEAFGLISFAMDAQNSFPQITNAYSLGLKIFPTGGGENSLIDTFGIADSQNLILKKYVGAKKEDGEQAQVIPKPEKIEIGTGHGIYVVKTAISGHGVTLKDLSSIIEASGGVKIQNWDATQENWMSKAVSLVGDQVVTLFVPSFWLHEGKAEPDLFVEYVRGGRLRISCLQKKGELPYFKLPILSIPSDRGSLILEGMVPLVGQAHYSGIHALFPVNTNIYSMAKTTELERASKSLDTLYDSLMKKARKLMLHKTKVAVGAKTILHALTIIEETPPKEVELKMGYANNLFALSIRWRTGKVSVLEWSKEIPAWKKICSSTSGSWFNFFPETSEVEALILYSFAIDGENSVPAIDNAYSLGVDIFSEMRLKGQDKVEEKETSQEILISTTTEKALPSNFDKEVVNLYFEEEEIELDGPLLTEIDTDEVINLGDEEIDVQPEQPPLTKKIHTILYVQKVFDHYSFNEKELSEIIKKSARYNVVKLWNVEQIDWIVELSRMKMEGVFSVLVPPVWLRELPFRLPVNFEKRIERGELRIISFNKKHDPANCFVPGLFVPVDRGRSVFKSFLTLFARPFYGGICSVFPSGQKLFVTEFQCDDKDQIKVNLESLFNNLQKEDIDLKDFTLKLNLAIKSILNFVKKEAGNEGRPVKIQMGSHENLLAFSLKWKTGIHSPKAWISDEISWKNICSTSSGFWFNYLKDSNEIEAVSLYILDDVSKLTTPSISNSYPMGFEIFNHFRKDLSLREEETEIDGDDVCRLLRGFYESEGAALKDEEVFFTDKELDSFQNDVNGASRKEAVIGGEAAENGGSLQKANSGVQVKKSSKKQVKKVTKKPAKSPKDFSITLSKNKSENIKPEHTYMGHNPLAVLIAVNDKRTAERLSEKFNNEKIKVFSTSHSHQAVKFLQNQRFHCLITHMKLAKGHGEFIVKEVRGDRNNQNYRIPIIVVLNDYETKGLINRIQPLINQIVDEEVSGGEIYSAFAKYCHPFFLPKKKV